MRAEGLADLSSRLARWLGGVREVEQSYLSTEWSFVARTAANSLTRCGRLPVFSICWIVPITISSLIPSVSTVVFDAVAPSARGDGGGDSSATRFGFSSLMRMVVVVGGLMRPLGGGDVDDEVELDCVCDRFDFFTGGSSPSTKVSLGVGCDWFRERFGPTTPRSPRFRLLRRVCMLRCEAG